MSPPGRSALQSHSPYRLVKVVLRLKLLCILWIDAACFVALSPG